MFQTSNPDVTVNPPAPPTTNTTTIQPPQPDLNKESTTTPVFNTSSQQQHNSHYETKEIDIDSQELFIRFEASNDVQFWLKYFSGLSQDLFKT